jgi:tRNA-splicing ligase RtcB
MSIAVLKGRFSRIHLWSPVAEVESSALDQLKNVAGLPWVRQVSVMPDVHYGKGATVGSVIAMKDALAPAAVGVDIGCGMGAIRTNLKASDLPESLAGLRSSIETAIPVGFNGHTKPAWGHRDSVTGRKAQELFGEFDQLDPLVSKLEGRARLQCGTLGGGNHFIELCLDEGGDCPGVTKDALSHIGWKNCPQCAGTGKTEARVWMMLHSGSRNIGKELAEIHIERAKKLMHNKLLPDPELAVFLAGTPEMDAYRRDLYWAQRYAFLNRQVMFEKYKDVMRAYFPHVQFEEPILCHHNYVSEEDHLGETGLYVTRKGAISARVGELGVIPGSMGTKSYIVEGLGNAESLTSASHGAGRRMSRGKAKQNFTLADLEAQTAGVECRKDEGVLDEIPGAYKSIDEVMAHQADLVKIKHVLKAVLCVKG